MKHRLGKSFIETRFATVCQTHIPEREAPTVVVLGITKCDINFKCEACILATQWVTKQFKYFFQTQNIGYTLPNYPCLYWHATNIQNIKSTCGLVQTYSGLL